MLNLYQFILNDFQLDPFFYNCTNRKIHEIDRPFIGYYFLISGSVLIIIYLSALIVIVTSDLMKFASYKMMCYLGVLEVYCIFCNSVITGYLGIHGANFCTHPKFMFVIGVFVVGCWNGTCLTCVFLTLSRCCDLNAKLKMKVIFEGKALYVVFAIINVYTIYSIVFTSPLLFDSSRMGWFTNPMIGLPSNNYTNIIHTINNICDTILSFILYAYLCYLLKVNNQTSQNENVLRTQSQIFIQSILICFFNTTAAIIYVWMQFYIVSPNVVLFAQIVWQWAHGSVGIVYITVNKTVRQKLVRTLRATFCCQKYSQIHPTTVIIVCQNVGTTMSHASVDTIYA
ncbi:unnamed protein product [Caenorhabditis angaria]|uniref:7TM GPCR serpentine receptor class x (Srx) domain-containing protein n=1 Tax=Caenorhabditis angaria TaxID=860376 RepID=A0A9P1ISX2_9PELO|nr:unnamed protein product [Caenorhabditis angaria]